MWYHWQRVFSGIIRGHLCMRKKKLAPIFWKLGEQNGCQIGEKCQLAPHVLSTFEPPTRHRPVCGLVFWVPSLLPSAASTQKWLDAFHSYFWNKIWVWDASNDLGVRAKSWGGHHFIFEFWKFVRNKIMGETSRGLFVYLYTVYHHWCRHTTFNYLFNYLHLTISTVVHIYLF